MPVKATTNIRPATRKPERRLDKLNRAIIIIIKLSVGMCTHALGDLVAGHVHMGNNRNI